MALGTYDANGIWHYGESDNIALFSDTLNKLADSASSAITSDRSRLATLEAGSLSGLIPIKPTVITAVGGTASVSSTGLVTFTNCTSISVDGVFSSDFRNYKFISTLTSAFSIFVRCRFRASGADVTATNYMYQEGYAQGSGVGASSGGSLGYAQINYIAANTNTVISGDIFAPQINSSTLVLLNGTRADTQVVTSNSCAYTSASQFTGFTLLSSSGSISGTFQLLGYND